MAQHRDQDWMTRAAALFSQNQLACPFGRPLAPSLSPLVRVGCEQRPSVARASIAAIVQVLAFQPQGEAPGDLPVLVAEFALATGWVLRTCFAD